MAYQPITATAPKTRLSDAERDTAVERLTGHVASGRLSITEFDARAGRIYSAVTRADLDTEFADLPDDRPVVEKPSAGTATRDFLAWAGIGLLCLSIWAVTSIATGDFLYPWPVWVIGPWGAMLALGRVTGHGMGCSAMRVPGR